MSSAKPAAAVRTADTTFGSLSLGGSGHTERARRDAHHWRHREHPTPLAMPWFQCEDCGDTLKKPKVKGHAAHCSASRFSCVDCLQVFDRWSVQAHTTCVTEHEKYALSITKPGQEHLMSAAAAKQSGGGGGVPVAGGGGVVGAFFLSKDPRGLRVLQGQLHLRGDAHGTRAGEEA